MFAFAPCGCGSTICAVALGRESVESGCPAVVCLDGWLAGGRRSVKAVPVVYSRFAALWGTFRLSTPSEGVGFRAVSLLLPKECRGTFPLSTPSEGVGFSAVFATPSEGVRGNVRTSGMRHGVLSGCPGHRGGNLRAAVTDSRCQ